MSIKYIIVFILDVFFSRGGIGKSRVMYNVGCVMCKLERMKWFGKEADIKPVPGVSIIALFGLIPVFLFLFHLLTFFFLAFYIPSLYMCTNMFSSTKSTSAHLNIYISNRSFTDFSIRFSRLSSVLCSYVWKREKNITLFRCNGDFCLMLSQHTL